MFDLGKSEKKLLIIEQDAEKRSLLKSFFSAKYFCEEADSIGSALEKIKEQEYCVILTACSLQSTDGLDLIPYL